MTATGARLEFPVGKVLYETIYPLDSPRVSPKGDSVAFVEHPFRGDQRGSLAIVDLKGEKSRLSEDFSTIVTAAWSPRGDEIWFSAAAANEGIALRAVNLSGRQHIVARVPGNQVIEDVSSDGRVLLSHWHSRGVLMALTPGETRERDLSWLDNSTPVGLSDDGTTLLFTELGEGSGSLTYSVWERPTDGSAAIRLGEGHACGLSPDGKWALAIQLHPRPGQLVLIPTGAGETKILTQDQINHRIAAWFPDGRRVLFVGNEPGKGPRLYVQSIDGGGPRAITPEATGGTIWMTWRPISPDGRLAVWFDSGFFLYPVDGGERHPVPGMMEGEIPIGWSSDGRALYVRELRRAPIKVFRLDVATGKREFWKEIPSPVGYVQMVMTPDGKFYAYGFERRTSDLYLVEGLK
jgi:eukaryotic-like serine/threonine-protein kinase